MLSLVHGTVVHRIAFTYLLSRVRFAQIAQIRQKDLCVICTSQIRHIDLRSLHVADPSR